MPGHLLGGKHAQPIAGEQRTYHETAPSRSPETDGEMEVQDSVVQADQTHCLPWHQDSGMEVLMDTESNRTSNSHSASQSHGSLEGHIKVRDDISSYSKKTGRNESCQAPCEIERLAK